MPITKSQRFSGNGTINASPMHETPAINGRIFTTKY